MTAERGNRVTSTVEIPPPVATDSRSVAVFDIDGTLYHANTLHECLERFHADRSMFWRLFFRAGRSVPGKLFWTAIARTVRRDLFRRIAFLSLRGVDEKSLDHVCHAYVHDVLPERQCDAVMTLLSTCRARGYQVLLVSGSMTPVVRHIGRANDVGAWLAAEPAVKGGRYTGAIANDVQGRKLAAVEQTLSSFDELIVVTDNKNDLPLVKRANRAWVVTKARNVDWWRGQRLAHVSLIEV